MNEIKTISIDLTDREARKALMKDHAKYDTMLIGHNSDDELTTTSINEDHIIHCTHQNNGWIQKLVFWEDGTIEELWEKGDK